MGIWEWSGSGKNFSTTNAFEVVNRRPGYYSDPVEDALVMRRMVSVADDAGVD